MLRSVPDAAEPAISDPALAWRQGGGYRAMSEAEPPRLPPAALDLAEAYASFRRFQDRPPDAEVSDHRFVRWFDRRKVAGRHLAEIQPRSLAEIVSMLDIFVGNLSPGIAPSEAQVAGLQACLHALRTLEDRTALENRAALPLA